MTENHSNPMDDLKRMTAIYIVVAIVSLLTFEFISTLLGVGIILLFGFYVLSKDFYTNLREDTDTFWQAAGAFVLGWVIMIALAFLVGLTAITIYMYTGIPVLLTVVVFSIIATLALWILSK